MIYKYAKKEDQNKRGTEPTWREAILVTMGFRFQVTEWNYISGFTKDHTKGPGRANNGQFYAIKQHRDNLGLYTSSSWPTGIKKLN